MDTNKLENNANLHIKVLNRFEIRYICQEVYTFMDLGRIMISIVTGLSKVDYISYHNWSFPYTVGNINQVAETYVIHTR